MDGCRLEGNTQHACLANVQAVTDWMPAEWGGANSITVDTCKPSVQAEFSGWRQGVVETQHLR